MTMIEATCSVCKKPFQKPLKHYNYSVKNGSQHLCSKECFNTMKRTKKVVICKECNDPFLKLVSQIKRSSNHFCSRSCAARFNNLNKKYGTRRSKLECFLSEELARTFPTLEVRLNSKELGIELDLYIPSLKIAIEVNGPTHYVPIYGQKKLNRIQELDRLKSNLCRTHDIHLLIVENLKRDMYSDAWLFVKKLVNSKLLCRKDHVQVF